jgi:glutathione synthase/RimK-type ligase-like ATP-grasp enzyme
MVDWRCTTNPRLPHHRISLPKNLETMILGMMALLKLEFAAIDMIQTPTGEYVFLEVNPNGQWLWLDDMLELGISDAVAHWLGGPSAETD